MTKEMYAANVKNWMMDMATGAKAMQKSMQFANAKKDQKWRVTARCYDQLEDGVPVHNLKRLAEVLEEPVKIGKFDPNDYLYDKYDGFYYIEMFGVRFYDFITEDN